MKKQMIFVLAAIFAVSSLCGAENLVVNPGFETPETTGGGWPSSYGDWNGDYSSIVGTSAGIVPLEGSKMLKLSGSSHGGSGGSASACQVFQIIDVSDYAELISAAEVSVSASAHFNRIAGDAQTDTRFYICIYAYASEPSTFPTQWEPANSDHGILARTNGFVYSDGDPATWERGEAELALPTNTDFVVIGVNANEDIYNDYSLPEFDGHFADDVSAEVIIPVLVGLEITGPNDVAEDFQAQYKATAYYDDGSFEDVTDLAIWEVEPNSIANIYDGLLQTKELDESEEITIYAQYSEGDITVDANKPVSVFEICRRGNMLEFDGVDDYVEIPDSPDFTTNTISVAAWVKALAQYDGRIASHYDHGPYQRSWTMYVGREGSLDKFCVSLTDTGEYYYGHRKSYETSEPVFDNTWHYVGFTFDAPSSSLKLYVDGIEDTNPTKICDDPITSLFDSSANVTIGCDLYYGSTCHYFEGAIDDVRIYDRVLSAEEIQAGMHAPLSGDEPNLVGYWDFDEGQGQIAYDMSGNGNDGQLGSGPDVDNSDPNWVDSNAPLGICSPPFANAGPDQTVYVDSNCMTLVTLDGSDSNDPDGDELTYSWFMDGVEIAAGVSPTIELSLGEYIIELIVNDGFDDSLPDELVITVLDATPPDFNLSVTPDVLRPHNHEMVLITPVWDVNDNCDDEPQVSLLSITSSQEDDGIGDGHMTEDILVTEEGLIYLRAEIGDSSEDRIYTITFEAADDSGNTTIQSAIVTVPQQQLWHHREAYSGDK